MTAAAFHRRQSTPSAIVVVIWLLLTCTHVAAAVEGKANDLLPTFSVSAILIPTVTLRGDLPGSVEPLPPSIQSSSARYFAWPPGVGVRTETRAFVAPRLAITPGLAVLLYPYSYSLSSDIQKVTDSYWLLNGAAELQLEALALRLGSRRALRVGAGYSVEQRLLHYRSFEAPSGHTSGATQALPPAYGTPFISGCLSQRERPGLWRELGFRVGWDLPSLVWTTGNRPTTAFAHSEIFFRGQF